MSLRRERFFLPLEADEDNADETSSQAPSELEYGASGVGRKADYWQGYRAAMAQRAPPFATSIASFDSDEDADKLSDAGSLPTLPRSPEASDASDDGTEVGR